MAVAWRIVKKSREKDAFSGEGARLYGGRWNSPGVALVYTSEHFATAVLELYIHVRPVLPKEKFVRFRLEIPDRLIEQFPVKSLPAGWRKSPPSFSTMEIGNQWFSEMRSAALAVPSTIVPGETNFLLNPAHIDFRKIRIGPPEPFFFDPRLLDR